MVGDATHKHEHNLGDVIIGDRAKSLKASTATGSNEGNGVYIGPLALKVMVISDQVVIVHIMFV